MKTLDIFKKYEALYNEADEQFDATDIEEQPDVEPDPAAEMTPEGEKYLIDLLIKAFLHEPDDSGAAMAKELQLKVDDDPKAVAAAIANVVEIGPEGGIKDDLAEINS